MQKVHSKRDIVIYTVGPLSGPELLKPLEFPVIRAIKVSSVMLMH